MNPFDATQDGKIRTKAKPGKGWKGTTSEKGTGIS